MIRDILVHLDGGPEDRVRLAFADGLAAQFDAFVTALYVNFLPQLVLPGEGGVVGADMTYELETEARGQGTATMQKIRVLVEGLRAPNTLKRLDLLSEAAGPVVASEARLADLFVSTRPHGPAGSGAAPLIESVLFGSGRPCFLVPPAAQPPFGYRRVLLAWRDSREASRSLAAAMPFLAAAEAVTVVMVAEDPDAAPLRARGQALVTYLDRRDIAAELRIVRRGERISANILATAREVEAQLLVMGGYGHSRLREWVLGGTTRSILADAQLPLFIAH